MEKTNITEIITKYFKAVCDAYSLGNVESSYNAPIMALFTDIGCAARDLSGERKGQSGENIDIKLWHTEEEVTETEPFAGVDPIAVEEIQNVVWHLKHRNIGILITDHNVHETLNITDRAYLLFEGRLLFHGSPEELAANDIVKQKYLGRDFELKKKKFASPVFTENASHSDGNASHLEENASHLEEKPQQPAIDNQPTEDSEM